MSTNNHPNPHDGPKHRNPCDKRYQNSKGGISPKKPPVRNPHLKASKPPPVRNPHLKDSKQKGTKGSSPKDPILESAPDYEDFVLPEITESYRKFTVKKSRR